MKRRFCLVLLVVGLFALVSCSQTVPSPAAAGGVHLVSVGIDYADSKVSTLTGTVADACETALCFSDIYQSKGVDCSVDVLASGGRVRPDAQNILLSLISLDVKSEDLIVFYFSGHGAVDYFGPFLAGAGNEESDFTRLYMCDVFAVLAEKPCRSVVILDCCYSGSMASYTVLDRDFVRAVSTLFSVCEKNRVAVIASSLADQNSLVSALFTKEGRGESHSLFTCSLLKALGWVHSSSERRYVDDICVDGYLGREPQSMTVGALFNLITEDWTSEVQIPEMNRTDVPVKIIPDKEWKK